MNDYYQPHPSYIPPYPYIPFIPYSVPASRGWICPRCLASNSPMSLRCNCAQGLTVTPPVPCPNLPFYNITTTDNTTTTPCPDDCPESCHSDY